MNKAAEDSQNEQILLVGRAVSVHLLRVQQQLSGEKKVIIHQYEI